jgi:hypothetical protein
MGIYSEEEMEQNKRAATRKRIKILALVGVVCVIARLVIKNPPPPKPRDLTDVQVQYTPGLLESMPLSVKKKMDPIILAKLELAQKEYERGQITVPDRARYRPAEMPMQNKEDVEAYHQQVFIYEKRRQSIEVKKEQKMRDISKATLVQFSSGGYIKVERANQSQKGVHIEYDRSVLASLPKRMVSSINENALDWEAPVKNGFVRLKPARGITVTVAKNTAKRITINKLFQDEI